MRGNEPPLGKQQSTEATAKGLVASFCSAESGLPCLGKREGVVGDVRLLLLFRLKREMPRQQDPQGGSVVRAVLMGIDAPRGNWDGDDLREEVLDALLVLQEFAVENKRSPRDQRGDTRRGKPHRDARDVVVRSLGNKVNVRGDSGIPGTGRPVKRQADVVNPGLVALCVLPSLVLLDQIKIVPELKHFELL